MNYKKNKMPERHEARHPKEGFTLIELAIALVVIGLVVGGILVGQSLVRAAELRSIISDVEKFTSAVNTFKVKYNCIPGDCINATDFFGTDPGGCPLTPSNTVPKIATCNGSGTDDINNYNGSYASYPEEAFRFWQQLADAGLIAGSYSGSTSSGGASTEDVILGINVPKAKINQTGWFIHYWNSPDFAAIGSPVNKWYANKTYFTLIGNPYDTNPVFNAGVARAIGSQDTWNIDNKIDDGEP